MRGYLGMRHGDYKFTYTKATGASALYDLSADPAERHDLSRKLPESSAAYRDCVLSLTQFMERLYLERRLAPPAPVDQE